MRKQRLQPTDWAWLSAAALLIVLQFWWLPGDRRGAGDSYSTAIEGKRGFYDTLGRLSDAGVLPEVYRETGELAPAEKCTLLLISPDRYPSTDEVKELDRFVRMGGSLVFAPNWALPEFQSTSLRIDLQPRDGQAFVGQVATPQNSSNLPAEAEDTPDQSSTAPSDDGTSEELLAEALEEVEEVEELDTVQTELTVSELFEGTLPWRSRSTLNPPGNAEQLLSGSSGDARAAAWQLGAGRVVVLDSGDVFSNRSMLNEDQAVAAIRFIEFARDHQRDTSPIIVSEFLNATQSFQNVGVLMSPSLRSGSLQLLLVAVLAGWYGFYRFGPARRDNTAERRSLQESAEAVGNLYFRTENGASAVRAYLDYVKQMAQQKFGKKFRLEDSHGLARRTGLDAEEIATVIESAKTASRTKTNSSDCAKSIRELATLLKHLG